jgi:hypothetical protein
VIDETTTLIASAWWLRDRVARCGLRLTARDATVIAGSRRRLRLVSCAGWVVGMGKVIDFSALSHVWARRDFRAGKASDVR